MYGVLEAGSTLHYLAEQCHFNTTMYEWTISVLNLGGLLTKISRTIATSLLLVTLIHTFSGHCQEMLEIPKCSFERAAIVEAKSNISKTSVMQCKADCGKGILGNQSINASLNAR